MGQDGAPVQGSPPACEQPKPESSEEEKAEQSPVKTPEKKKRRQRRRKNKQSKSSSSSEGNSKSSSPEKKPKRKNGKKKNSKAKRNKKNAPKSETEKPAGGESPKGVNAATFKLVPAPNSPARKAMNAPSSPLLNFFSNSFPLVPPVPLQVQGTTFFGSPVPSPALDHTAMLSIHNPVAIMKQVEWYFKAENLEGDIYLRTQMDARGYVPIEKLCEFPRLSNFGITSKEVETCCAPSRLVKVKNGAIKKRDKWYMYVLPGDKVKTIVESDDEAEFAEVEASSQPQIKSYKPEEFFDLFREKSKKKSEEAAESTPSEQTAV